MIEIRGLELEKAKEVMDEINIFDDSEVDLKNDEYDTFTLIIFDKVSVIIKYWNHDSDILLEAGDRKIFIRSNEYSTVYLW